MTGFATTRWSLVLQAGQESREARKALDALCAMYRPPVFAYIRAHGHSADAAEDLVQSFFLNFIEHAYHAKADAARGRFRSFLVTAIKRFLIDQHKLSHRLKRGGGVEIAAIDDIAELTAEPGNDPESAFERTWAMTVLDAAITRMRDEAERSGKGEWFAQLSEFIVEPADKADYARAAAALHLRQNTLAVAVHRLRQRLRDLIVDALRDTVTSEGDLDDELRILRVALGQTVTEPRDEPA